MSADRFRAERRKLYVLMAVSILCAVGCFVVALICLRPPAFWPGVVLNIVSMAINMQGIEGNVRLWIRLRRLERR